jgi:hypothetical protein
LATAPANPDRAVGRAAPPPAAAVAPPAASSVAPPPAVAPPAASPTAPPPAVTTPPPRAPVAIPPPNAAPTSASSLAAEETAIRQVLQRYRAGYEGLNSAEVKAVYPGLSDQALEKLAATFKQYTSLKQEIEIDRVDISPDGQTANVTAEVTTAPIVRMGRVTPQRSKAHFLLKKSGDVWLIQDVNMR